jgi:hypothetical protein
VTWSVVFYLDRNQPWWWRKIVSISVLAPCYRDFAIIWMIAWSVTSPAAKTILRCILTDAGVDRYGVWFDRNYSRQAMEEKYPWLKAYRK